MSEAVVRGIRARGAVWDAKSTHINIEVVRVSRIPRTVRIEGQCYTGEMPRDAPVVRKRRYNRFLLIARTIIEEPLQLRTTFSHEREIIRLHQARAVVLRS